MIERSDKSPEKEEDKNSSQEEDSGAGTIEDCISRIFGSSPPTERFGDQKPKEESKKIFEEVLENDVDVEIEDVEPLIDRAGSNIHTWEDKREQSELDIQRLKTEFESELAENVREISGDLALISKWAKNTEEKHNWSDRRPKNYRVSGKKYTEAEDALEELVNQMSEIDKNYEKMQRELAKLGRRVENSREVEIGEINNVENLGTREKSILDYERKAASYSFDKELYEEIQDCIAEKDEHESEFLSRQDHVKQIYLQQAEEVEAFIDDSSEIINKATTFIEKLSNFQPRLFDDMLDIEADKILDDGEEEIKSQYNQTAKMLGLKAAGHEEQIRESLQDLEKLESIAQDYFALNLSEDLREDYSLISDGEPYGDHLIGILEDSIIDSDELHSSEVFD